MNTETQTALMSEGASICKLATDLFGRVAMYVFFCQALGMPQPLPDEAAFVGTLAGITPINAVTLLAYIQKLDELNSQEVEIAPGTTVNLGEVVLKFGLASR